MGWRHLRDGIFPGEKETAANYVHRTAVDVKEEAATSVYAFRDIVTKIAYHIWLEMIFKIRVNRKKKWSIKLKHHFNESMC